jgi:hypothetical protein
MKEGGPKALEGVPVSVRESVQAYLKARRHLFMTSSALVTMLAIAGLAMVWFPLHSDSEKPAQAEADDGIPLDGIGNQTFGNDTDLPTDSAGLTDDVATDEWPGNEELGPDLGGGGQAEREAGLDPGTDEGGAGDSSTDSTTDPSTDSTTDTSTDPATDAPTDAPTDEDDNLLDDLPDVPTLPGVPTLPDAPTLPLI